jgi:hypothetical protein
MVKIFGSTVGFFAFCEGSRYTIGAVILTIIRGAIGKNVETPVDPDG